MCAYFCVLKIIPIFGTVILCTLNAAIHAEARATEILSGARFKKRHFPRDWGRLFEVILSGVPNEIAGLRKTIIAHGLLSELSFVLLLNQWFYSRVCFH